MERGENALVTTRRDGCPICGSTRYRPRPMDIPVTASWRELRGCSRCATSYVRIFEPQRGSMRREDRAHPDHVARVGTTAMSPLPTWPGDTLGGRTVVIVDDDDEGRAMLSTALELAGAAVVAARTAREGFQAVQASAPDVIVTDLMMPHQDGYWLLERVRDSTPDTIPVVGISGVATQPGAVLAAGFDAFLRKPIDPTGLVVIVADLVARPG
jgi:CheY-like chemotaxis protein